jgi:tRNA (guanosine-2'-O-)-methyltransferase
VVERVERFLAAASVARSAEQWVDVVCHKTAESAVAAVTHAKLEMVGAHPDGELLPEDLASIPRVAIVLGNERDGIAADLAARCARRVRVPMRGFVESLNVSVTAAILLQAATRGRVGDLDAEARTRMYARGLYHSVRRARDVLAHAGMG